MSKGVKGAVIGAKVGAKGGAMSKMGKAMARAKGAKKAAAQAAAEAEVAEYPYVVMGATIFCDKGTHFRYLELPLSHGVDVRDIPAMNEDDCKYPANIPIFGVCLSEGNPSGQQVQISDTQEMLPFGDGVALPIIGKPCLPKVGKWLDAKEDTLVDGKPALTTQCTLICCYGGVIGFADDGQGV